MKKKLKPIATMSNELVYEELKFNLHIDLDKLDKALAEQSSNQQKAGELYALFLSIRDGLEAKVKLIRSKMYLKYKGKGGTVPEINAKVDISSRVQAVTRRYIQSIEICERYKSLKESWSGRNYALSDLGELWKASYFSVDGIENGRTTREQRDSEAEEAREKMNKKRKKFRHRNRD